MTSRSVVVGLATAAMLLVGCGPSEPDDVADPRERPWASTQRRGVTIGVALSRDAVDAGAQVEAVVNVTNVSGRTVHWRAGGCELRGSITVRPAEEPARRLVPAADGERRIAMFVDAIASVVDKPGRAVPLTAGGPEAGRGCQADHGFADLPAGDQLIERVGWTASTVAGAPLPPGRYVMRASFPILVEDLPLVPASFEELRDLDPLLVEVPLEVGGGVVPIGTGRAALQLLLAGTAIGAAVEAGHVDAGDASLRFETGTWVIRVALPGGGTAIGQLPADGSRQPSVEVR